MRGSAPSVNDTKKKARGIRSRWGCKGRRGACGSVNAGHLVKGVLKLRTDQIVYEYPGRCKNRVCSARESIRWRRGRCNACGHYLTNHGRERPADMIRVDGRALLAKLSRDAKPVTREETREEFIARCFLEVVAASGAGLQEAASGDRRHRATGS